MSKILLAVGAIPLCLYLVILVVLYFKQERLIFHPTSLPSKFNFRFSSNPSELYVKTPTAKIHGLIFEPPKKSRGTILYFHGNAGALDTWGQVGERLALSGHRVVMMDYQSYGKSEGELTDQASLFESALKFAEHIQMTYPSELLTVWGRSLGTGFGAHVAARMKVGALILETPFLSLAHQAQIIFPFVPKWLVRYPMPVQSELSKVNAPIYLIHGDRDEVISHQASLALKVAYPTSSLFLIRDAGHNDLDQFSEYQRIINQILASLPSIKI